MAVAQREAEERIIREQLAADKLANPIAYFRPRPSSVPFFYTPVNGPERKSIVFLIGGKRSGKTYAVDGRVVIALTRIEPLMLPGCLEAMGHLTPPLQVRHWCVDIVRNAERLLLPIYLKWIPHRLLDIRPGQQYPGYTRETRVLRFKDGSFIEFLSYKMYQMDQASGESHSRHIIAYDEPPPEGLFDSQKARVADVGGVQWGAMTLDERRISWSTGWIDNRILEGQDGPHVAHFHLKTRENQAMCADEAEQDGRPEEADAIRQGMIEWESSISEDERRVVIDGESGWCMGRVYKQFDRKIHAQYMPEWDVQNRDGSTEHLRGSALIAWLSRNQHGSVWCGMDAGRDHPTCCLWVFVAEKDLPQLDIVVGDHIVFREYKRRGATTAQNIAGILQKNKVLGVAPRAYFGCRKFFETSQQTNKTDASVYARAGLGPFRRGKGDVASGITMLEELIAPRPDIGHPQLRFIAGMCRDAVNELLALQYNPKWTTGNAEDRIIKLKDDFPDCAKYIAAENLARRARVQRLPAPPPVPKDPLTGFPLHMGLRAIA